MKKYLLLSLLIFGNLFGIKAEKGDISIEYAKCSKYITIKFGLPYCINITNRSHKPIVIDPSIVSTPLCPYQEVAKSLQKKTIFLIGAHLAVCALCGVKFCFDMNTYDKISRNRVTSSRTINLSRLMVALDIAMMTIVGGPAGYWLGEYGQLELSLQKKVLHEPIIIWPGESVKKLFWLK